MSFVSMTAKGALRPHHSPAPGNAIGSLRLPQFSQPDRGQPSPDRTQRPRAHRPPQSQNRPTDPHAADPASHPRLVRGRCLRGRTEDSPRSRHDARDAPRRPTSQRSSRTTPGRYRARGPQGHHHRRQRRPSPHRPGGTGVLRCARRLPSTTNGPRMQQQRVCSSSSKVPAAVSHSRSPASTKSSAALAAAPASTTSPATCSATPASPDYARQECPSKQSKPKLDTATSNPPASICT